MLIFGLYFEQIPFFFGLIFTSAFLLAAARAKLDYQQTNTIEANVYQDSRKGLSAEAARTVAGTGKFFAVPYLGLSSIVLGIAIIAFFSVPILTHETLSFSLNALGPITAIIIFVLFGKNIAKMGGTKLRILQESNLPQLEIQKDKLLLSIFPDSAYLGKNARKPKPVEILLNEITQLKLMNFQEVSAMGNYEIGPDIKLFTQSKKDLFNYLRGQIERPSVFARIINNPTLSNVLIQGDEFFYLFSLPLDQARALEEAGLVA